jgi:hypothetical protein
MERISKPVVFRVLTALLLLYIGFIGFIWWAMKQPPETFGRVMSRMPAPAVFLLAPFEMLWIHARAGSLQPGDVAPDFTLLKVDKSERIELSSMATRRPVVLVFGSYT